MLDALDDHARGRRARCDERVRAAVERREVTQPGERDEHWAVLELLEEADVVVEQDAHVVDGVAHLRQPVDAEPEGEARPLLGVDADAANTLGWTIPQPPSSIQPVLEHVRQPLPLQIVQVTSNSADGSVNGK